MKLQAFLAILSPVLALAGVITNSPSETASSSLAVELTSSNGLVVESLDDLILVSKVTNRGDSPVRVVKYGGVLDGGYTQAFIVRRGDQDIHFTGAFPHLTLTYDDEALYTSIAPGQTVTTQHKVAALYDFQALGTGEFTFTPIVHLSPSDHIEPLTVSSTITVEVTDDVSARSLLPRLDKRAAVSGCTTNVTRQNILIASYYESKLLAVEAARHVQLNPASPLLSAYFKSNTPADVAAVFTGVADEAVAARLLSCADPYLFCPGDQVLAYTDVLTSNIYFCPVFFEQLPTHRLCTGSPVHEKDIRGASLLHKMVQANSFRLVSTNWKLVIRPSCSASRDLSAVEQLANADNFNCFATEVYVKNNCA